MAAKKRSKSERTNDFSVVSELHLKGHSLQQIADHLATIRPYKLSFNQIHKDLVAIREEWKNDRLTSFEQKIDRELRSIDLQEREAWAAYYRSCTDAEKKIQERKPLQSSKKRGKKAAAQQNSIRMELIKETKTVEGQVGDPRWLDIIATCRAQRMKLLGLDVNRVAMTSPDGQISASTVALNDAKELLQEVFVNVLGIGKIALDERQIPPDPEVVNIIPYEEQNESEEESPGDEEIPTTTTPQKTLDVKYSPPKKPL